MSAGTVAASSFVEAQRLRRTRFDHMGVEDTMVWAKYLDTHHAFRDGNQFQYDYRVAIKPQEVIDLLPGEHTGWVALRAKRIDVVVSDARRHIIVEVKPVGSSSAIGQLLLYKYWFQVEARPALPVELWLVCARFDQDMVPLCKALGIELVQVPFENLELDDIRSLRD